MMNQVVLVGRLVDKIILNETENGKKYTSIILAVPRSYKNENGEYDTDFIKCRLWGQIAESTSEFCEKGDLIGIRGRIEIRNFEIENEKKCITEIVAEKVTFLSSNRNEEK